MHAPKQLSADELADVDTRYKPFPAFAQWPRGVPHESAWDRQRAELTNLRAAADPSALRNAIATAMRAAAWDTGAIEGLYATDRGLTMTVATQAAAWEDQVASRAPDARAFFEAQLEAYDLVMDVVTDAHPVHEVWIRHLHEVLTSPQDTYTVQTPVGPQERPLPRGAYKDNPNHVSLPDGSTHSYAPVDETGAEMGRLVSELGSEPFIASHPIVQAAYAHYCFVAIHPFADGNGRVARALASVYLYRAASIPLLVLADQRDRYLLALESGDVGNYGPFVTFVGDSARAALGMVAEGLRTALAPNPSTALSALRKLLTAQGGLTHQELDAVAQRLVQEISAIFQDALAELDLPPGVSSALSGWGQPDAPLGFRSVPGLGVPGVLFQASPPAAAQIQCGIQIVVSTSRDDAETFRLIRLPDGAADDDLTLGLSEAFPELTVAGQYRVRALVERTIGSMLTALLDSARSSLGQSGYTVEP